MAGPLLGLGLRCVQTFAREGQLRTDICMDVSAELKTIENAKAIEALGSCLGERLTGYGVERGALVLRFANGVRVTLHVALCDELLDDIADVVSAFGRFLGGELKEVSETSVCLHGIGDVTISVK
jgi:hypothetical protein